MGECIMGSAKISSFPDGTCPEGSRPVKHKKFNYNAQNAEINGMAEANEASAAKRRRAEAARQKAEDAAALHRWATTGNLHPKKTSTEESDSVKAAKQAALRARVTGRPESSGEHFKSVLQKHFDEIDHPDQ